MIIKGTSVSGARRLSIHLMRTDTNERADVWQLRGVVAEDLSGALAEMEAVSAGGRTKRPFYHASINTLAKDRLDGEQRAHAIDRLESELGLTGQPRVVVVHEKEGREHMHIVWSRIDIETMRAISDSHNYRKHETVARELEREFGHERVQGAHIEREGQERPVRTPGHDEMQQADRSGLDPREAKEILTGIWHKTETGQEFADALKEQGWAMARGDKRDHVAIDPFGDAHSLGRRIDGAKAKDVRERMADLDPSSLPSVEEARAAQRERARREEEEREKTGSDGRAKPRTERPAAERTREPEIELPVKAEQHDLSTERVPPPELPDAKFVEMKVSIDRPPPEELKPEQARDDRSPAMTGSDSPVGFGLDLFSETLHNMLYVTRESIGAMNEIKSGLAGRESAQEVDRQDLRAFAAEELDRRGPEEPERQFSAYELATNAAARREHYAQQQADRERNVALDRMGQDIKAQQDLRADDVRALHRKDLETISHKGEEHLRDLCTARERELAKTRDDGRERDR